VAITTRSKDIILIAIKTATKNLLSINYGFQTNNVSISISLGFQNSVKTVYQKSKFLQILQLAILSFNF
jgi:hypothetical protein